jgi:hypothetical protein
MKNPSKIENVEIKKINSNVLELSPMENVCNLRGLSFTSALLANKKFQLTRKSGKFSENPTLIIDLMHFSEGK